MDAKLSTRQQEVYCVEQELNKLNQELKETSEGKQQPQIPDPDLRNEVVKTVTTVCFSVSLT